MKSQGVGGGRRDSIEKWRRGEERRGEERRICKLVGAERMGPLLHSQSATEISNEFLARKNPTLCSGL